MRKKESQSVIQLKKGLIENCEADVIVNASNGVGYMGGFLGKYIKFPGGAEALHFATKGSIEREAKQVLAQRKMNAGGVFITSAGGLKANYIFHAITMNKPGQTSSLQTIETCLKNIVNLARTFNCKISLPSLGTGTGRLNKQMVAKLYFDVLKNERNTYEVVDPQGDFNSHLDFYFKNRMNVR